MAGLAEALKQGFELVQAKRWEEARGVLEWALALAPKSLDAHAMLGFVGAAQKRWAEAAEHYEVASELMPSDVNLVGSAGRLWFEAGDFPRACALLERAVALGGASLETWFYLGKARCFENRPLEGTWAFNECVKLGKRDAELLGWVAQCLGGIGQADRAVECLNEALKMSPRNMQLAAMRCTTMNYAAKVSAREIFEAHRDYGEWLEGELAGVERPRLEVQRGARPAKLRVGIVSPDLRGHAMSFLTLGLVENLDRSRYEVACYYAGAREDAYTQRYRAASVLFRNIDGVNGLEVAKQIASDRVHVLIDPAGHTTNNRLPVFGLRPAPVQMTYLGYPNTTGVKGMDWRVVDALTDPPGFEALSTEKLARVEGCFLAFRPAVEVAEPGPPPCVRNGFVTFGSFSASQKYNDGLIALWARVLNAVPGSRLLLKTLGFKSEQARRAMVERFVAAGLDASRVEIEGPAAGAEAMLPQYERVDISLDTFPYNGTTTICESFYMGVPLVSLSGERSASRVGLSLLTAVGLGELCAGDEEGYVRVASSLARDTARLAELRRTLRGVFRKTIGDEAGFTRRFERVLEMAWGDSSRRGAEKRRAGGV